MKILKTKRNKLIEINNIEIVLTIEELDDLIGYLNSVRDEFVQCQNEPILTKIQELNGEINFKKLTNYVDLVESGNEIIGCHAHYQDYTTTENNNGIDIVVHTNFKAMKKSNGTFEWKNFINSSVDKKKK